MSELTATDKLFEADRPGYYIFEKLRSGPRCYTCGKKYDTRLEMNQFCAPNCKNRAIKKR